jgi:hypothetical protein
MRTFYFNTGVKPQNISNFPYEYHKKVGNVIRDGVLQCPYDCDAPENATPMFLCSNPNLDESKYPDVIVREVFNTSMHSKYVYLNVAKV